MKPLIGSVMKIMFGRSSLADPGLADTVATWRERMLANDPRSLIRFGAAIWARDDVSDTLGGLDLPTLVVVGAEDVPLPPAHARRMADAIPGARLAIIARAGHLCTIEQPEAVTEVVAEFLDGLA
jgi:pimeloyl-ACP methyl ester carboxylesterase